MSVYFQKAKARYSPPFFEISDGLAVIGTTDKLALFPHNFSAIDVYLLQQKAVHVRWLYPSIWAAMWENQIFAYARTKTRISVFVFTTRIVQSLYFLNLKFQVPSHLQWFSSPVYVVPSRKPRRPVFSERGSYVDPFHWNQITQMTEDTCHTSPYIFSAISLPLLDTYLLKMALTVQGKRMYSRPDHLENPWQWT